MKNIFLENALAEQIEVVCEQRKQQEFKKLAEYSPQIDGGRIFCYNRKTKEFKEATFRTSEDYVLGSENRPKLDVEKDMVYVEALNLKNATKRLLRGDWFYRT